MRDHHVAVADRHYTISPRALCRAIDDEAIALDLDAGQYYGLNAVATRVWQLLAGGSSVSAICVTLLEEFDVPPEALRADVDAFIGELVAKGLAFEKQEDGAPA
jgi:hypothetical protein